MSMASMGRAAPILLALAAPAFAQDQAADLQAFPPAEKGMSRHVITLPEAPDEYVLKVEILPGKVMEVDCNRVMISARTTKKTVDGWGYDYLVVDNISQPATTMMACPDGTKKQSFVAINLGTEGMQRYNSKLPLVVYAPSDIAVKYRIWRADAELGDARVE